MNSDLSQPPSAGGPQLGEASDKRERTPTRDVVVVGAIVVVGALAFGTAVHGGNAYETTPLPPLTLVSLTVALPVIFGASMSIVRGFIATAALAAVFVVGGFIGVEASDYPFVERDEGIVLALVFYIVWIVVMLTFWLGGVGIGSVWRRVARRQALGGQ